MQKKKGRSQQNCGVGRGRRRRRDDSSPALVRLSLSTSGQWTVAP